ncbi:MAG: PAS domain S-box protein, partial [bacterium]|nr:PAS domain S-box protein [bacterium]
MTKSKHVLIVGALLLCTAAAAAPAPDLRWRYGVLAGIAALLLVATVVAICFARLAAALTRSTATGQRTTAALQAGEDKYRSLFMDSPDAYLIAIDGVFVDCNRAAEVMLRGERRQIIGQPPEMLSPEFQPDGRISAAAAAAIIAETWRTGSKTFEWQHRRLDGSMFPVEVALAAMTLDGTPALFTVWRDITERKRVEHALHETNAYLENLINYANAPIIVWDPQFRITRFNHAFEFLTGRTEAEVLGQTLDILFPAELVAVSMQLIRGTQTGERWETVEIKILHRDASVRTVLWNSATLFAADGSTPVATIAQGQDVTERTQAEAALRESMALLAKSQAIAHLGSWELDLAANRLTWSDEVYRIFGLQPQELSATYESFLDRVHPDDRARVDAAYRDSLRPECPGYQIEHRVIWPTTGAVRHIQEKCEHLRDAAGTIVRSVGMAQDITERQQAEAALRAEEEKYRMLTESMKDVVWTLDTETMRFLYVSPSVQKLRGYSAEEIIAQPADAALTPQVVDAMKTLLRQRTMEVQLGSVTPDHFYTNEVEQPCKDGTTVWTEVVTNFTRNAKTGHVELHGVTRDISARKQAEARLKEREEQLHNLFDNAPIGIFHSTMAGRLLTVNPALARMLGYAGPGELIAATTDMTTQIYADPRIRPQIMDALMRADGWVHYAAVVWRRKDQRLITVDMTGRKVLDSTGAIAYLEGFIVDITERTHAEADKAELEARNRQLQKAESLGRMAGAIAHRFNNQLQSVLGNLELAMEDLPRDAEPRATLNTAMLAARQATEVSQSMLTYLGQMPTTHTRLDLATLCRQHLPELCAGMPNGMSFAADLPEPGPAVHADAHQLQQVLANLLTNAWEAGGASLRLSVTTIAATDIPAAHHFPPGWQPHAPAYACLAVADTGSGIATGDIEKIFDPFFSTKFTGRGMGLALVIGIVRAHDGGLTVASEPGRGCTVQVFLPAAADAVARPPVGRPAAPAGTPAAPAGTVLLIEDEAAVRTVAARMIERCGFAVLAAPDGSAGLALYRQHQVEICCVICDLAMPDMDGWATLTALRQRTPDLPVILASGYDEAQAMAGE